MEMETDLGADVGLIEGNPTLRVPSAGRISLGHWPSKTPSFTWSFWANLSTNTTNGELPDYCFALVHGPRFIHQLSLREGRVFVYEDSLQSGDLPNPRELDKRSQPVTAGRWMHVCVVKEKFKIQVYLDGHAVLDTTAADVRLPYLADFQLRYSPDVRAQVLNHGNARLDSFSLFDDVAIFDRALSETEALALANARRGELSRLMQSDAKARRLWRLGWPWSAVVLAGLVMVSLLPAAEAAARALGEALPQSAYQPVWLVILVGEVGTLGISKWLAQEAQRNDQAKFDQAVYEFGQSVDTYFERIADFMGRARDWVASQSELTPDAWERWCKSNHFPHEITGLIGIGYAEQLLPVDRAGHEARWGARHGFPYHVWPDIPESEAWRPRRLQGKPRLPVVLYQPDHLEGTPWRINGSILGRDLLAMRSDDPRFWGEPERLETGIGDGGILSSGLEEVAPAGWYGAAIQGLRLYAPLVTKVRPQPKELIEPEVWRGVIFASVDPRRWLEPMAQSSKLLGFRIYTAGGSGEILQRVADSSEFIPATEWRSDAYLTTQDKRPHYGYRLAINYWSTPEFEAQSQRHWPWAAAGVGGSFTLLAAGLLFVQVRARQRETLAAARLGAAHAELDRLSRERARLSRDLHDGTIQNLYAVGLHLRHARHHATGAAPNCHEGIEDSQRLVQDTIVELRHFLMSLQEMPSSVESFSQAAEELLSRLRRTIPVEFPLEVDPAADGLPPRVAVQLVQVVREAVSNALRHGDPRRISVRLMPLTATRQVRLEVQDDGTGFVPAQATNAGFGLRSLRERAMELGGTLTVESAPGSGTTIRLDFPVTDNSG